MILRIFVILSFCSSSMLTAQDSERVTPVILQGMEMVYDLDFPKADSVFDAVIQMNPKHPQGYYFKASSYFYQIISGFSSDTSEEQFMQLNRKAIAIAEEYENIDPIASDFYKGTVYGNIARYHAMEGNFIKAFFYAKKSKSLHESIIEHHPNYYDAYLTVGVYNYYAAAMPRWIDVVAGLLGLGGDRALGIRQLEIANEKGALASIEAKFFLANVYFEEGDYERSLQCNRALSVRFSRNPFLYNQLGLIYFSMEDFREAERCFIKAASTANIYSLSSKMFADYFLGRISKLKNDYPAALNFLLEACDIGKNRKLFKSIDAWIVGAAYYQAGEVMELAGKRSEAVGYYELAKNHEYAGKPTVQASENRLKYGLSEFEIEVMRARHTILFGSIDEGRKSMLALKPRAGRGEEKFLSQINFYLGRAELADSNYQKSKSYFLEALRVQSSDGDQKWREPQTHFYLGLCYVRLKEKNEAGIELKKVLDHDDYFEAARFKFLANKMLQTL